MFNPFSLAGKAASTGMAASASKAASKAAGKPTSIPEGWTQPTQPGGLASGAVSDVGASSDQEVTGKMFDMPAKTFPDQMFTPSIQQGLNGQATELQGLPKDAYMSALASPSIQRLLQGNGLLAALLRNRG